jgi:phosphoglycolate phosphatase
VGDSPVDVETAKNAGMAAVGVSWGFRPAEELREAGAGAILDRPGELLALLGCTVAP